MKRRLLSFLVWFQLLVVGVIAQSLPPANLTVDPSKTPEVLQVLDPTGVWAPMGTINSANHSFTSSSGEADILVTDPAIGMLPNGPDNSPFLQNLMNAQSHGTGVARGYDVLFPRSNAAGQQWTTYYFSQPFVNSRIANYHCPSGDQYPSVNLVFAPGVDGFIFESPSVSPDGGTGMGEITGCGIVSMGFGQATIDVVSNPNTLTNVAFIGDPAGVIPLSTWHVGDGIIAFALQNAYEQTNAVLPTSMGTTVTNIAGTTITLSNPISSSFGQNGNGTLATATFTQTGTNNFNNNDTFHLGPNTYTFQTSPITSSTPAYHVLVGTTFDASAANLVTAINWTGGEYNTFTPGVGEGAHQRDPFVGAAYTAGSGVITFHSEYPGLDTNSYPSVYCAGGGTCAGTAAGSFGAATFSGAVPNPVSARFYQLPLSQAFKIQTTVGSDLVTIVSGPRKVYGGDIMVSDAFKFLGASVFGPIAGTAGAQTFHMRGAAYGVTAASVTHLPGAEGNMWILPAGLQHRETAATTRSLTIQNFPIGESLNCSSGGGVNCELSLDENNIHDFNLVARWQSGDTGNQNVDINETYSHSYIADLFDGATLGSTHINPDMESPENGNAKWSVLMNCSSNNRGMIFGGYTSGSTNGCANPVTLLPPTPGGLTQFGVYSASQIGSATYAPANNGSGGQFQNGISIQGGSDRAHGVCLEASSQYDIAWGYNGCTTNFVMGIGWNPQGGFWYFSENVNTAMRFVRNNAGYTGYGGTDTLMTEFPDGILMGGENQGNNKDRQFEMSPLKPVSNAHAAGDVAIFTNAVPGGASEWVDVPVFSTTLTAPVAVGATTAAVAACPTATIPASLFLSDMGASAAGSPDTLGTYVSCTSLTMTISAALHAGATGDTVKILQWTTGAELSNDPNLADYSFTVLRSGSSANKDLTGRIALAGGAATYTLSGIYASPPDCITADVTTPANANSVLESITTLTFTGTGTDTLKWVCAGRN